MEENYLRLSANSTGKLEFKLRDVCFYDLYVGFFPTVLHIPHRILT